MSRQITWTGGFEVLITECHQDFGREGYYGAFVNVVAYANSQDQFLEISSQALAQDCYEILEIEDVQPIDLKAQPFPQEEQRLIERTFSDGHAVAYGQFNFYPKEGLDA